jgi:hypothetical protein
MTSFMGAGMLLGYGIGGNILENHGGGVLYQRAAVISFSTALLYLLLKVRTGASKTGSRQSP